MNQQPSSAREVAEGVAERFRGRFVFPAVATPDLANEIESALKERDKRAAQITAEITPIGADDCYWCERVKRAVAAITKE